MSVGGGNIPRPTSPILDRMSRSHLLKKAWATAPGHDPGTNIWHQFQRTTSLVRYQVRDLNPAHRKFGEEVDAKGSAARP